MVPWKDSSLFSLSEFHPSLRSLITSVSILKRTGFLSQTSGSSFLEELTATQGMDTLSLAWGAVRTEKQEDVV